MRRIWILYVLAVLVAPCLAQTPTATPTATPASSPTPREPGLYATLHTTSGPITVRLFEKETPGTVRNFTDLALGRKDWQDPVTSQIGRRPLYDGTTIHRVIDGFIIQGGDPKGDGTGDTGFTIRDEIVPSLKFDVPGRLAMANRGPGTGDSQFFITLAPTPSLDGKNTIFGQVVEGMDNVSKIAKVPTDKDDRPVKPIKILSITFRRERAAVAAKSPTATPMQLGALAQ